MLNERQIGLFKLLDLDLSREKEVRESYRKLKKEGYTSGDFTRFLTKRVHAKWAKERRESSSPYLGD